MSLPLAQPVADASAAALTAFDAVVLGLIEGITEYLPVSSTGHLILTSGLLGLNEPEQLKSAVDAFNIVIQGGAILAVLGLYFGRVIEMLRGLIGKSERGRRLLINLLIAFAPAAVFGFLFASTIKELLFNAPVVLTALAVGGVFMIVVDRKLIGPKRKEDRKRDQEQDDDANPEHGTIDQMTWRGALLIGLLQCVAMVPGTSRSMMTITGGVIAGLRPRQAAEFSFLLGLPTLGGACVYEVGQELGREDGPNMFEVIGTAPMLIGLAVATVSAAFAVRWLVAFLNAHGLVGFGVYRLVLAGVLGVLLASNLVQI